VPDDIVRAVIETNYVAADQMARRVAPLMIERGWGRIVNVTTKLDTMNRPHTSPYGASNAALEMATEVWAKEVEGTGLTVNIVNPGAGANTPGMAEEMRAMNREGRAPRLVEPGEMVPPLLYVVSREADTVNGWRFDANLWDRSLLPAEAAAAPVARPASNCTHSPVDQGRCSEVLSVAPAPMDASRGPRLSMSVKSLLCGNGRGCRPEASPY
jgi:NAD(P)-dependent dehydrogenase (short-subunit alcohol dehydrogenase family)